MSMQKTSIFLIFLISLSNISQTNSYPIFPTILTVSIPILEPNYNQKDVFSETRVENNYVRWLQASGADLVVVHPWSTHEEIDILLQKVNGVLFQGNLDLINPESSYYAIIKHIYKKVISLNDSGIKMPLLVVGDDVSLLASIIITNDISVVTQVGNGLLRPNNINLYLTPDKAIILNEFEEEDIKMFM